MNLIVEPCLELMKSSMSKMHKHGQFRVLSRTISMKHGSGGIRTHESYCYRILSRVRLTTSVHYRYIDMMGYRDLNSGLELQRLA